MEDIMEMNSSIVSRAAIDRKTYNDFVELSERCLEALSFWNIDKIEKSVNTDWKELYRHPEFEGYEDENIFFLFNSLKSHVINRKQFKEMMRKTIQSIKRTQKELKEKMNKSRKNLYN